MKSNFLALCAASVFGLTAVAQTATLNSLNLKAFGTVTAVKPSANAVKVETAIASLRSVNLPGNLAQGQVIAKGLETASKVHGKIVADASNALLKNISTAAAAKENKALVEELFGLTGVAMASLDGVPAVPAEVNCGEKCVVSFKSYSKEQMNNLKAYLAQSNSSVSASGLTDEQQQAIHKGMIALFTGELLNAQSWSKEALENAVALLRDYVKEATVTNSRTDAFMRAMLSHVGRMDKAQGKTDVSDDTVQAIEAAGNIAESCAAGN